MDADIHADVIDVRPTRGGRWIIRPQTLDGSPVAPAKVADGIAGAIAAAKAAKATYPGALVACSEPRIWTAI